MTTSKPKRLGKYEILEVIGRGGMGVVYKAVDPEIGRLVGIKMMTHAVINDPVCLKRFYREAQSAGKLQHPNIVTIFDLGVQEATPYIVMEFLEGESLDTIIHARRDLPLEEKLNIVTQICDALAYAHEQTIVHRDIKPGNVMLLKDSVVKLVDFGIARIGADYVTRAGQMIGSIQYMSPEQIQGDPIDHRTDVFSTGTLLYQFLTYALPFDGRDVGEILLAIVHRAPPPLGKFLETYPPELDGIVNRVLAKNPAERYQSAAELGFDLTHIRQRLTQARISGLLEIVEQSVAAAQWAKSKEQILQVLKLDRQNARANELLHEVQEQIQKQQRSERINDLRSQAELAISRNALDEAVRYLDAAVSLDSSNEQLLLVRDSTRRRKERAEKLDELLASAKSAYDTADLESALAAVQQALSVDANDPAARELHAAISSEMADRSKMKEVHDLLESARRELASRHFTAALEQLRKVEAIDPEAPRANELIALASTGQQQERRRKELEQASREIEEALDRNDYELATAKAAEALQRFPNDRGITKLKGWADRQREASEKRKYVEAQVSAARRLLEDKRSEDALVPLKEALALYPDEFMLQSMYSLVTDCIERDRAERFKLQVHQKAKDALRRKAYHEAVEILQAAQRVTPSGEFDDLLQFAQDEANNSSVRRKIDVALGDAQRLMSAEEYTRAIEVLEAALGETDDHELRITLTDARRHLEQFNADLREAIATASRLLNENRYSEAVRFAETHADRFAKAPEFSELLEKARRERRRAQAISIAKEQVRNLLESRKFDDARASLNSYREEFGEDVDLRLLLREIVVKQSEAASVAVAQALRDCQVLLFVGCFQAVLDILNRVSSMADLVSPELKQQYELAHASARVGSRRERQGEERRDRIKQRLAEAANHPTLSIVHSATASLAAMKQDAGQETQLGSVSRLEGFLGEVTLIAGRYPENHKIQAAVGDVQRELTMQIALMKTGSPGERAPAIPDHQSESKAVPVPARPSRPYAPPGSPVAATGGTGRAQPGNQTVAGQPRFEIPEPSPEHVAPEAETIAWPVDRSATPTQVSVQPLPSPVIQRATPMPSQAGLPLNRVWAIVIGAIILALLVYLVWESGRRTSKISSHRAIPSTVAPAVNSLLQG